MPTDLPMLTVAAAHARYEAIRPRLPEIRRVGAPRTARNLLETADHYDGYLFDSFGVLNVGDRAIPGAAECLVSLRALGKPFCILTNAASYTSKAALSKYHRLGLDVRQEEIVSSRDVLFSHLRDSGSSLSWAAICAEEDAFEDATAPVVDLLADERHWDRAEGFMFLSSARWTQALQDRLVDALRQRPRPVTVGNPDLVAPREGGLTIEPGYWAHDLEDRTGIKPAFYGKPYRDAFLAGAQRLALLNASGPRIAMVGDTLHTDILGGQAAGLDTILVTDHGIYAGQSLHGFVTGSKIDPTWTIPSI